MHDQRDNLQGRRKFFLWLLLVNSNDNFECDWHFELSDNELSDNELSDNELSDDELSDDELSDDELSDNNLASELVENRSFFYTSHNWGNCNFKTVIIRIIINRCSSFRGAYPFSYVKKKKGFQRLLYSYAKQIIGIDQDSENT